MKQKISVVNFLKIQHRIVSVRPRTMTTAEDGYGGSAGGRRRALRGGSGGAGSSNGSDNSSIVEYISLSWLEDVDVDRFLEDAEADDTLEVDL